MVSWFGITVGPLASRVEMLFGTEQLSWMLAVHNSDCLAFTVVREAPGGRRHPGPRGSLQSSQVAVCLTPLRDIACKDHGQVPYLLAWPCRAPSLRIYTMNPTESWCQSSLRKKVLDVVSSLEHGGRNATASD